MQKALRPLSKKVPVQHLFMSFIFLWVEVKINLLLMDDILKSTY